MNTVQDKRIFYGLLILVILTVVLIVGITFINKPQTQELSAEANPTATPFIQPTATATPEPTSPFIADPDTPVIGGSDVKGTSDVLQASTGGDEESGGLTPTPTDTISSNSGTLSPTSSLSATMSPTLIPDELPTSGIAQTTILIIAGSLLLMVLGLAL